MENFKKDDVLRHLAELGYDNIDDAKLQEFMADLKKLIKYEEKRKRVGEKLKILEQREADEAKSRKPIQRQGRLETTNSTSDSSAFQVSDRSVPTDSMLKASRTRDTSSNVDDASSIYVSVDLAPSSRSSRPSLARNAVSLLDENQSKPGGFIRVRSGPNKGRKPARCDPVALHQQYRESWAKSNIPGERSHKELRWKVRGWMMGEEPS